MDPATAADDGETSGDASVGEGIDANDSVTQHSSLVAEEPRVESNGEMLPEPSSVEESTSVSIAFPGSEGTKPNGHGLPQIVKTQ